MKLLSKSRRSRRADAQSGYILITLMLMASMVVMLLAAVLPKISQQLARDREEEMVHRGVQYSRAVRRYFKKFGRYPTRIEELENTNNQRFLRKKYKDPITGKDFKLLHLTDVQMSFGPTPTGLTPISQMNGPLQQPGGPGGFNGMRPGLGGPGSGAMVTNSNPANSNAASSNNADAPQSDASEADQAVSPQ